MAMTFGIHVGHLGGPMDELRKLWRFADAAGFDWTSVADHFQESPPQGGDGDCFEAIAAYTAMAMETTRVRLGALVFCVNYRNPGLLAKSLCTIDHISGGRVECGIGAGGGTRPSIAASAFPSPALRPEGLELRRPALQAGGGALQSPSRCSRASGSGSAGRARSGRFAPRPGMPTAGTRPTSTPRCGRPRMPCLDDWCAKEGRDPRAVLRSVNVGFYLGADAVGAARGEALYLKHWGANNPRGGFFRGTPKDVLAMCEAYQKAGVHRLNIALREGPYDWEALQAFAEVVLPAFGIRRPA
jgi:alkanesulfonate monooxygenase SsuD/methylene tetrahydromethanopterin reductase-like flavin-dependent oxidoreductase (luciferase family)